MHFNLVCIGGGSGGLATSYEASKFNQKIALIEAKELGGACLQVGCIPKKIMHQAASLKAQIDHDAINYGIMVKHTSIDWSKLIKSRDEYIAKNTLRLKKRLHSNNITLFQGRAKIINSNTIEISYNNQQREIITTDRIVICTGSHAIYPPAIEGSEYGITSNEFFQLQEQPKRAVVVGGGYISVELSSLLQKLGTETYVILKEHLPLKQFDEFLQYELMNNMLISGIRIKTNCLIQKIQRQHNSDLLSIYLDDGSVLKNIDCLIWAIGRQAFVDHLNLESLGVTTNSNGSIIVDDNFRTSVENIYAIGDLLDTPHLTPVAIWQGRELVRRLFYNNHVPQLLPVASMPTAVFIYPPIGVVGLTEELAKQQYGPDNISCYQTKFIPLASSIAKSPYTALMKIVCLGSEEKIVGIHIIGYNADEIIQGFAVAIQCGLTRKLLNSVLPLHPTLAEELIFL